MNVNPLLPMFIYPQRSPQIEKLDERTLGREISFLIDSL